MKTLTQQKTQKRLRLKAKIRSKIFGTATLPRLSVFRSNAHIYAQLINDEQRVTIAAASDLDIKKGTKKEHAVEVGTAIGKSAIAKGITVAVFDRNGFKYTGRVQLLADAARAAGLKF